MPEGYVDLSGVYSRLSDISREIRDVGNDVIDVHNMVLRFKEETQREIEEIKFQLEEMERKQRLRAALQRAISEIVRVRQELEDKFGANKLVREYMLGILQANDLGLITKSTISKCTEELMISAPGYWLAPALIALAAWISDNKNLANRALKEAMKRDEEKTCLLFALVTRRVNAGRIQAGKPATDATFQWLNRYFSLQDPTRMRASIVAYIDAYTNGVFGEDADHICSDHINNWMKILMDRNPNFAEEQKQYWINQFSGYCASLSGDKFNALRAMSPQFPLIDAYVSKINAAEGETGIRNYIKDIVNQEIDRNKLVKDIDEQLMKLVKQYDEKETPLRDEEQYLNYVKEFEGDEELATAKMNDIRSGRKDENVDFAQRLNESILNPEVDASARRTAVVLLQGFINDAFASFISADKESYPASIDLYVKEEAKVVFGKPFAWKGSTENAENRKELVESLQKQYDEAEKAALAQISDEEGKKKKKVGTIVAATTFFTIIGLIVGLVIRNKGVKMLRKNESNRRAIMTYYKNRKEQFTKLLNNALDARESANKTVEEFMATQGDQGNVVSL